MKNYSDTIGNLQKREYSAKGYKFMHQCQQIALNKKGINFNSLDAKPIKEKIKILIDYLIFDQLKSIPEIKEIIKNRLEKNTLN